MIFLSSAGVWLPQFIDKEIPLLNHAGFRLQLENVINGDGAMRVCVGLCVYVSVCVYF